VDVAVRRVPFEEVDGDRPDGVDRDRRDEHETEPAEHAAMALFPCEQPGELVVDHSSIVLSGPDGRLP